MDNRAQAGLNILSGMAKREIHEAKKEAYENVRDWGSAPEITKEDILWYVEDKIKGHEKAIEEKIKELNDITKEIADDE